MSKVRTESYLYLEPRLHQGHLIGHRAVHVLPKGTLHPQRKPIEIKDLAHLGARQGVIQAPRKQDQLGVHSPAIFGEAGEAPRERHEGTARGVGRRW